MVGRACEVCSNDDGFELRDGSTRQVLFVGNKRPVVIHNRVNRGLALLDRCRREDLRVDDFGRQLDAENVAVALL